MTADKLHDAITLLPSDLIAEADRQRSTPRPVIRWQRYAAMAACFVLMVCGSMWCLYNLGSGGAKETAAEAPAAMQAQITMDSAEAAPMMEESAPENLPAQGKESEADSAQGTNSTACYANPLAVTFYIEGIPYELTKGDRSTVARLLLELDYREDLVCECIAEITIVIGEMEYSLNLEEGFIRGTEGQAILTNEQLKTLQQITTSVTK